MTPPGKKIWFPAKTYGYGWGPPVCWQGWAVLAVFVALVLGCSFLLAGRHTGWYIACVAGLSGGLILVCRLKGEKPRWRWGKGDDSGK